MTFSSFVRHAVRNWRRALRGVLLSAAAASLAWWLASYLPGSTQPTFAGIAAVTCLSPGVSDRGRQAIRMLAGVALGILVGTAGLAFGDAYPVLRVGAVTLAAMLVAASFGFNATVIIQAGASAIIVVGSAQSGAGFQRIFDAAIGGIVGLFVSQVLFPPDPVRIIAKAADRLLDTVALSLEAGAEAVRSGDVRPLRAGGEAVRRQGGGLTEAIDFAEGVARWTIRGLLNRRRLLSKAERWRRKATRIGPMTILFGEDLADAIESGGVPADLADALRAVAGYCRQADAEFRPPCLHPRRSKQLTSQLETLRNESAQLRRMTTEAAGNNGRH
ncbi:FUSC family protein [Aureimonas leprariae]|uniref:FUSC family protein n=1 Tax=Plantimonas leprariae TaxID=2615207 RepID=UPI0013874BF3|nr:FUSC family protein [Aureimonas leprariae]